MHNMTGENDSDEILTQGLSADVIDHLAPLRIDVDSATTVCVREQFTGSLCLFRPHNVAPIDIA